MPYSYCDCDNNVSDCAIIFFILFLTAFNGFRKGVLAEMQINLFAAARVNDVDVLTSYLSPAHDIPPLRRSCIGGSCGVVSIRDWKAGFPTLLHTAAEANCLEFVRALLGAGADAEAFDVDGNTALHRILQYGDSRADVIEEILMTAPALVHCRNRANQTPAALLKELLVVDPSWQAHTLRVRVLLNAAFEMHDKHRLDTLAAASLTVRASARD